MRRPRSHGVNGEGLALLPLFFLGTIVMVLAIVAMARIDDDWADVGAVVLLVIVAGLLLLAVARRAGDDDDDGGEA
jgi:hypothetical protein